MMNLSAIPSTVTEARLAEIAAIYGIPLWVYDADVIRHQIKRISNFDVVRFAQKAASNLSILQLMRANGVVLDAVSLGEIERSIAAGYRVGGPDSEVVLTADLLDRLTLE